MRLNHSSILYVENRGFAAENRVPAIADAGGKGVRRNILTSTFGRPLRNS
ncbi:MAG: hypothetical protein JNM94_09570 [Phycisphaerae bacterium]|nr:hypothetical protein [Phycisphaerae bacterium]